MISWSCAQRASQSILSALNSSWRQTLQTPSSSKLIVSTVSGTRHLVHLRIGFGLIGGGADHVEVLGNGFDAKEVNQIVDLKRLVALGFEADGSVVAEAALPADRIHFGEIETAVETEYRLQILAARQIAEGALAERADQPSIADPYEVSRMLGHHRGDPDQCVGLPTGRVEPGDRRVDVGRFSQRRRRLEENQIVEPLICRLEPTSPLTEAA